MKEQIGKENTLLSEKSAVWSETIKNNQENIIATYKFFEWTYILRENRPVLGNSITINWQENEWLKLWSKSLLNRV